MSPCLSARFSTSSNVSCSRAWRSSAPSSISSQVRGAATYGVVGRELATWTYLTLLGAWAVAQSRRLRALQD